MLLLNQFFPPDPAPTGQLLADVAVSLAAQGASVTVVCARPSYASSAPAAAHPSPPQDPAAAVRIIHTPAPPFSRSPLARLAAWGAYFAGALFHSLRSRSSVVLTLTTPPLLGLAGYFAQRLRRARHVIWEMDLYPDVAVALHTFKPGGLAERITGALADFTRRRADAVIALGPCMRDRLIARGIPPRLIHVVDNWAPANIAPLPMPPGPAPGAPAGSAPLTILYSGNLGAAHDPGTIALAIRALAPSPAFKFVFAGGGPRRPGLEAFCRRHALPNVVFLPYQDSASMAAHLAACHIGLVTQLPETLGCLVPSKTYSLMAAARPVLFIGPPGSTTARIIDRFDCGWRVPPGDPAPLVGLLRFLAAHPERVAAAGTRARQAYERHFAREIGVRKITSILCGPAALAAREPAFPPVHQGEPG